MDFQEALVPGADVDHSSASETDLAEPFLNPTYQLAIGVTPPAQHQSVLPVCSPVPDAKMIAALQEVSQTIRSMADGTAQPKFFLSALDPGVGKTRTYSADINALVNDPSKSEIGVVVFVSRIDQIAEVIKAANLTKGQIAVLTSDTAANSAGMANADAAQVLLTTQQRLKMLDSQHGSFSGIKEFYFHAKPRDVRIWDESAMPGEPLILDEAELAAVYSHTAKLNQSFANQVDAIRTQIKQGANGTSFQLYDFKKAFGAIRPKLKELCNSVPSAKALAALFEMSNSQVSVRHSGYAKVCLDYKDTLPSDMAPMLILDASGRVRETYTEWENGTRGNLHRLKSAAKSYSNLTVHVWDTPGSKSAWLNSAPNLILGIINTINTKPEEPWVITLHKPETINRPDLLAEISNGFWGDPNLLHFITWGNHTASNAYRQVPNIILGGLLELPDAAIEGMARAAAGLHSGRASIQPDVLSRIALGEHLHNILQAVGRTSVRDCFGSVCGQGDAYIIAPLRSGVAAQLPKVFPNCQVKVWSPLRPAQGTPCGQALQYIEQCLQVNPTAFVSFKDVASSVGINGQSNFRRSIRMKPAFKGALAQSGIVESVKGPKRSGFRLASTLKGPVTLTNQSGLKAKGQEMS